MSEKQSVSYILKRSLEKAMGKALDYARMSGMSDRAFEQYDRTVKNDFNRIIEATTTLLLEQGHIDQKEADKIIKIPER